MPCKIDHADVLRGERGREVDRTGVPLANGFPGWSVNKTHHLRRWVQMLVGDALRGCATADITAMEEDARTPCES